MNCKRCQTEMLREAPKPSKSLETYAGFVDITKTSVATSTTTTCSDSTSSELPFEIFPTGAQSRSVRNVRIVSYRCPSCGDTDQRRE
jgi:hypothetical protein